MFGPEFFTVKAYKNCTDYRVVKGEVVEDNWSGELLCRDCGENAGLPTGLSISLAEIDDWNDEGHGLYCDDCGAEISPPGCYECGREEDVEAGVTLHEDRYGRNVCSNCEPTCEACDEFYEPNGDGWDGLCPDCADLVSELMDATDLDRDAAVERFKQEREPLAGQPILEE